MRHAYKMKRKIDSERILKNLRTLIEAAEAACAQNGRKGMGEKQLAELGDRVQAGLQRLRETGHTLGERADTCYRQAENRLRDSRNEIEERLRNRIEATDLSLRTHPYRMAAVTFSAGMLVGACLRAITSR